MKAEGSTLLKEAYKKLSRFRESGIDPFSNEFKPAFEIGAIRANYSNKREEELKELKEEFSVAGRVMRINRMGKANFVSIRDRTGEIQLYLNRAQLTEKEDWILKQLDVGDFIGACGTLFLTRTKELTILVNRLYFLTKALRALPEKWHGLKDSETRYRQRYVDLIVNQKVRETLKVRAKVISLIRAFLEQRGYIELETPIFHPVAGGALARPFITHHNALNIDLYLRIATELYLKRLLIGGFERVYEIGRCFRNEGISSWHNPEYTMLEFYQAYSDFEDLMKLSEELFSFIVMEIKGGLKFSWQGKELNFEVPFARKRMEDAVCDQIGFTKEECRNPDLLKKWLIEHGRDNLPKKAGWGKLLMLVFEEAVEPNLQNPTFITHFPLEISPLSKANKEDRELVDRFELIVAGKEIANAFSELNDPEDQRRRFEEQAKAKALGDEEAHPIDEDFIRALEYGMPPTAGEGIGIDRLVMLLTDSPSIREVIPFPLLRPEE